MNIVIKSIVQWFENVALVNESYDDLVELFEALKHVKTHLEGWWMLGVLFAADFKEGSRKLKRVI